MPYIYILHFDQPLAHAYHYAGCTENLKARLTAHANGAGSRLMRELYRLGTTWHLGGLMVTTKTNMRRLERALKDQKHSHRYCQTCSALPGRLSGTMPYDTGLLRFDATSQGLRRATSSSEGFSVDFAKPGQPIADMEQVKWLMRADKDALGFIPAAGEQGLQVLVARDRLVLAKRGNTVLGYAAFTTSVDQDCVNIHQTCVRDEDRLKGIGHAMIARIADRYKTEWISAKVRVDLAANHFWTAEGFVCDHSEQHATSGRTINHYLLERKDNAG